MVYGYKNSNSQIYRIMKGVKLYNELERNFKGGKKIEDIFSFYTNNI